MSSNNTTKSNVYVWKAYQYVPSRVLAIVAIVLFAVATFMTCAQFIRALVKGSCQQRHQKTHLLHHSIHRGWFL